LLVLRTASVMAVYAVATAVVARGGPITAAGHQVAFQVWLAASLLADSLAVASQTLVATVTAAGQLPSARMVRVCPGVGNILMQGAAIICMFHTQRLRGVPMRCQKVAGNACSSSASMLQQPWLWTYTHMHTTWAALHHPPQQGTCLRLLSCSLVLAC
jgi:hypothetical protein